MQDFAPITPSLQGALSSLQAPCRIDEPPSKNSCLWACVLYIFCDKIVISARRNPSFLLILHSLNIQEVYGLVYDIFSSYKHVYNSKLSIWIKTPNKNKTNQKHINFTKFSYNILFFPFLRLLFLRFCRFYVPLSMNSSLNWKKGVCLRLLFELSISIRSYNKTLNYVFD